ncbi:MAG: GreA/GreB family elongation factor [Polyangiaceae bacterium]
MDKQALIEKVRDTLKLELVEAERLARETAAAANHPEAKPENDKDTRKIELSYLAAGQAARARELETGLALLIAMKVRAFDDEQPIQAGALVELDVAGETQRVLLIPAGGGLKLKTEVGEVSIVTPQSPLGRELLGKTVGDSFELVVAGRKREVEIVAAE